MKHAKTFVKVPSSARLSKPQARPDVGSQAIMPGDRRQESGVSEDALLPLDPRPLPSVPPPAGPAECASPALDEREADRLDDTMRCPDRRRVLQTLCVGGRATAATLGRVLRLTDKAVSRHLSDLRRFHLVHRRPREGQHVWYECDPTRVHFTRDDRGRDVLTLRHPSGAEVTRKVPTSAPAPVGKAAGLPSEITPND